MPQIGLQLITPLLLNFFEEIHKINEKLPDILEITSEIIKTADTI